VRIAVVGKYVELLDAYKSIYEALWHAGIYHDTRVRIKRLNAEKLENGHTLDQHLRGVHGILVPGGFGDRGIEGKIRAIQYTREKNIPFFGICLGMQCAVIEFARNVVGLKGAHSTEFNKKTPYPVISLLEEQQKIVNMGGTMRLGAYPCALEKDTRSFTAYAVKEIRERHRHRYEFNNEFKKVLTEHGLKVAGTSPNGELVEIIELPQHRWFVAGQFHPEFKSKPDNPHPLFREFIKHALEYSWEVGHEAEKDGGNGAAIDR
jgi:CTP synthase